MMASPITNWSPTARRIPASRSPEKAHPIFERTAPAIVSAVRPGQPELIDDGVVGSEDLHAVESASLGAAAASTKTVDHLFDLASFMAWLPSASW